MFFPRSKFFGILFASFNKLDNYRRFFIFRRLKTRIMIKRILSVFTFVFTMFFAIAEEGMLIPSMISAFENDMQAMGMKLSAEDIYNINSASLKDAIFQFGGGCTAEVVSSKGLLLTNHHCGYSQIQSHSSLENDYLKNGFWAKTMNDELPNPGLTAMRIVRIEDVTQKVFEGAEGLTGSALQEAIKVNIARIIAEATANSHYTADVKPFYYGNEYYMMVKETFKDVRFVGTPPNSIGKFGGDTDNWVWPRHTGDFSVFRIYANADNEPAAYAEDNVPYTPIQYLKVSARDRVPGEFTMVYGFPGTTEQHLSSGHLDFIMNKERPARISMRDKSLSVINTGMSSSDLVRIQYASKQARIANAWKKWIGQIEGLHAVDALGIKKEREKAYLDMAATKEDWKSKYGGVIDVMNGLVDKYKEDEFAYSMAVEYLYVGPEMFGRARVFDKLVNSEELQDTEKLKESAKGFFKNYNAEIDQKIFALLTAEYVSQLDEKYVPAELKGKSAETLAESIYNSSILVNEDKFCAFLDKMSLKSIKKLAEKDLGYKIWKAVDSHFRASALMNYIQYKGEMNDALQTYVEGKLVMFPDAKHWPDANSTLRITYGKLEGSAPHDGMAYTEHTTLDGIVAKNRTGNPDFEVAPRMLELAEARNYGGYDQDGELWVCFSGSNHTTGGNSGSPVLDAEGNLMGLNFDRSWESTMSDFMFDASRCRNIVVDIRYVMWVMDVYSGAKHLVDEMTIVR